MQWFRVDLHLHTPASADYQDPDAAYIDLLRKAEMRGLDIIAFTDHNTVGGYAAMTDEIEQLALLERLGRAQPDELRLLNEYRRLLEKILVLPGFEFTATFGFHILGVFSPATPLRQIEHVLLQLNVPSTVLDTGTSEVGASSDVLTAYRLINEAGGICIAAHANSTHGVAMLGMEFGGQTRIAYTQDHHLHALEVTDLTSRRRNSTQRFFDGTKPEYPRRMRCIQGSDAHRLNTLERDKHVYPGIGERITEVALSERSFEALLDMFQSNDFSRSRPFNPARSKPYDFIQAAREEGPSLVQSFHESMSRKGGNLYAIVADVCAFANGNGGTIYIGMSAEKSEPPVGIGDTKEAIETLYNEISRMITPTLDVEIDVQETQGKSVIRIQVPRGDERPYAIDDNKIYVRDEAETSLAVRDEIVNLVLQGGELRAARPPEATGTPVSEVPPSAASPAQPSTAATAPAGEAAGTAPPRAGVEIVDSEERSGTTYYSMRDLRNGNIVKNVTRTSARKLWHYAIKQREGNPVKPDKVQWQGDIGLWRRYQQFGEPRYDLVQREGGKVRVYYGVSEGGMHGAWQLFLAPEEEE
jgi:hypothetical protein